MAVTEIIGFRYCAQLAHLRFTPVPSSMRLGFEHPHHSFVPLKHWPVEERHIASVRDVCLDLCKRRLADDPSSRTKSVAVREQRRKQEGKPPLVRFFNMGKRSKSPRSEPKREVRW